MGLKLPLAKIGFFLFGLAGFVYLVLHFGVDQIAANIRQAGWSLCYVVLVWLVVYLLNASAWTLTLGAGGGKIPFLRLFILTVSGFAINYVTPFVALGGEPYRVKALSPLLGTQQSISAVILYRMVHLLGHMLVLLSGIVVALAVLPLPVTLVALLAFAGLLICCVIVLTVLGHRYGFFTRVQSWLAKTPLLRRLAGLLGKYESQLVEMDRRITAPYHHARPRLVLAVALESLSRICMGIEVYFIVRGIGIEISLPEALFLYIVYSIIINLLFFIPLNFGAREGGLALGMGSLALPPLLGVYMGVVMRIREFFWIMLGLLFILLSGHPKKASPVAPV
jgi:uncharacterized protein (TIRG00374 family)